MLIRAVGSPLGAELSVATQAQVGTGKGVRDFWALNYFCCLQRDRGRESLVGMLLLEDIFLRWQHWAYKRPHSLSQRIFCQSKCLKFFSRNLPGPPPAVTGVIFCCFFRVIIQRPCHGRLVSLVHTSSTAPSPTLFASIIFLPQFSAQDCVCFAATHTLPFPHYSIFLVTCKVWFGLLGV